MRRHRKIKRELAYCNNIFDIEKILKDLDVKWQTPVITEKTFYEQNKFDDKCLGFPWAEVIDRNISHSKIYDLLKEKSKGCYTCCQHIYFRKLIPLFAKLGIETVYACHKVKDEDILEDILILPCPLYAVNIEDERRNKLFKNVNLLEKERKLWYSFQGGYNDKYMSNIRQRILNLEKKEHNQLIDSKGWHFEKAVYGGDESIIEDKLASYNQLLLDSRFSLCPSGSGPNSIRFWECLATGSIPVLMSDKLDLSKHDLWPESIVIMEEKDVERIEEILREISPEDEKKMRANCLKIYSHFKDNFKGKKNDFILGIDIKNDLINAYYKIFGHFFLDHIFILFKIKKWLEDKKYNIKGIYIKNFTNLNNRASFVEKFYRIIFNNIILEKGNNKIINVGTIIGSIRGSENDKIYLDRSEINIKIPEDVMENGRKLTNLNKLRGLELREIFWKYCQVNKITLLQEKNILIVDRKTSPRKLDNLDILLELLKNKGYKYKIINMEDYSLEEQIRLTYSYNNILMPCSSGHVHISFMRDNTNFFELCESGFRYPNSLVYGNRYNVNTKVFFIPLSKSLERYRNFNNETKKLYNKIDNMPCVSSSKSEEEINTIFFNNITKLEKRTKFIKKIPEIRYEKINLVQIEVIN